MNPYGPPPEQKPLPPQMTVLGEIREYVLDLLPGWPPSGRECFRVGLVFLFMVFAFAQGPFMAIGVFFIYGVIGLFVMGLDFWLSPDPGDLLDAVVACIAAFVIFALFSQTDWGKELAIFAMVAYFALIGILLVASPSMRKLLSQKVSRPWPRL